MKVPISRFTVHGNSMNPTLKPGQDVISFNWFIKPKVGDIVVVDINGKEIIKRINKVYDRTVYLTGDNKGESTDSRNFGPVSKDQIAGKVIYKSDEIACPKCNAPVIGIYGRKDAICKNCGFKLICGGE